uniref:CopG domain protein DNA-binding domain protein n=1 Tax=Solibacter usitatus (strain Ellin6076) TaxID=234267 RepID=Q01XL9_SOLUE
MSNFRNRNRLVYFRVSEDEFQEFKDLCTRYNARNMSDLVRSALKALTSRTSDDVTADIVERLQQLENSVERLNHTMTQNRPERQA